MAITLFVYFIFLMVNLIKRKLKEVKLDGIYMTVHFLVDKFMKFIWCYKKLPQPKHFYKIKVLIYKHNNFLEVKQIL
jgi:hypothetical protein